MFEKAGITTPPANWDEFLDACAKLKTAGYTPLIVTGGDGSIANTAFGAGFANNVVPKNPDWSKQNIGGPGCLICGCYRLPQRTHGGPPRDGSVCSRNTSLASPFAIQPVHSPAQSERLDALARNNEIASPNTGEFPSHCRTEMLSWAQMKKAKKESSAERHSSYKKPALRSEAFARAFSEAKLRVAGSGGLRSLFEEAAKETASLPKARFKENWLYLQTMLRLIRAYEDGKYKEVSQDALLWIVTALNYLVDPFDLIPDRTPFLGFVDDAIVVEFVVDKTRQTLDDFMIWETKGAS
jgi:uncharacterized membrane protein YkvA (DUF1232 family)